jgi:hypothetical protein
MNKWVSLTKPTKAYRLEKYRMAASLGWSPRSSWWSYPF